MTYASRSLLGVLLGTAAAPAAAQTPQFLTRATDGYEVHAPSQMLLDAAAAQLDSARAQFSRYFQGNTPKIHVVVAPTRDELNRFDVAGLRQRVGDVLAWTITVTHVTPGGTMEMRSSADATPRLSLLGNLSAAIVPSDDGRGSLVRFTPPSGAGAGVDIQTGDVIRGLNGVPAGSPAVLIERYNALAAGAAVRMDLERAGKTIAISFAKPAGEATARVTNTPPGAPRPVAPGASEPRILSHEAGHHLIRQWLDARLGGRDATRKLEQARLGGTDSGSTRVVYGSALLPDWIDEAGATISESVSQQAERRKYILDNFGQVIPLARLFSADHPAVPGLRQMAEAQRAAGTSGQVQQSGPIRVQVSRPLDGMDAGMFYAQSLSVMEFIAEREGPTFVGALTEAVARGDSMETILGRSRNLPKTVDALGAEWMKWLTR